MTAAQTAKRLNVDQSTLRKYRKNGDIKGVRKGYRTFEYDVKEIERFERATGRARNLIHEQ